MPNEKKLKELAAVAQLYGVFNGPQQDERAIQSREQQGRIAAAMELMGLQQQQQEARAMDAFRQQQLMQSTNEVEQRSRLAQGEQRGVQQRNLIDALGLVANPGASPLVLEALRNQPGFESLGTAIDTTTSRARKAAVERTAPQLKALKDDDARALLRPSLAEFPGAYEEALAMAFPPQPTVTAKPVIKATPIPTAVPFSPTPAIAELLRRFSPMFHPSPYQ